MPYVAGIFQDGAITGEFANACDIEDGLVGPHQGVLKLLANHLLRVDIGQQIGQVEIAVTLVQQSPSNPGEQPWLTGTEEIRGEGVDDAPELRKAAVILACVIALIGTQLLNLLGL